LLGPGVRDPLGGINSLWPLFGIANQLLATVALCVATTILVRKHGARYMWITAIPLAWLVTVNYTAAWQKLFSQEVRVGFLAQAASLEAKLAAGNLTAAQIAETQTLIFNARLDAVVCGVFLALVTLILADSMRGWAVILRGARAAATTEAPFVLSKLDAKEF